MSRTNASTGWRAPKPRGSAPDAPDRARYRNHRPGVGEGQPYRRDRLPGTDRPAADRPAFPSLFQSGPRDGSGRAGSDGPDAGLPARQAAVRRRGRRTRRIHRRCRTDHPQRELRRRLPRLRTVAGRRPSRPHRRPRERARHAGDGARALAGPAQLARRAVPAPGRRQRASQAARSAARRRTAGRRVPRHDVGAGRPRARDRQRSGGGRPVRTRPRARADPSERAEHAARMARIAKKSGRDLWPATALAPEAVA